MLILVLSQFKNNPCLTQNQAHRFNTICLRSCSILVTINAFDLTTNNMRLLSTDFPMSIMQIENRTGLSTDPCGLR